VGTGVAGTALAGGGPPPIVGFGVTAAMTGRGVAVGLALADASPLGEAVALALPLADGVSDGAPAAPSTPSAIGAGVTSATTSVSGGRNTFAPTIAPAPMTSMTATAAAADRAIRIGALDNGETGAARSGGGGARPGTIASSASNEAAR
jgi:hypothetical protein